MLWQLIGIVRRHDLGDFSFCHNLDSVLTSLATLILLKYDFEAKLVRIWSIGRSVTITTNCLMDLVLGMNNYLLHPLVILRKQLLIHDTAFQHHRKSVVVWSLRKVLLADTRVVLAMYSIFRWGGACFAIIKISCRFRLICVNLRRRGGILSLSDWCEETTHGLLLGGWHRHSSSESLVLLGLLDLHLYLFCFHCLSGFNYSDLITPTNYFTLSNITELKY